MPFSAAAPAPSSRTSIMSALAMSRVGPRHASTMPRTRTRRPSSVAALKPRSLQPAPSAFRHGHREPVRAAGARSRDRCGALRSPDPAHAALDDAKRPVAVPKRRRRRGGEDGLPPAGRAARRAAGLDQEQGRPAQGIALAGIGRRRGRPRRGRRRGPSPPSSASASTRTPAPAVGLAAGAPGSRARPPCLAASPRRRGGLRRLGPAQGRRAPRGRPRPRHDLAARPDDPPARRGRRRSGQAFATRRTAALPRRRRGERSPAAERCRAPPRPATPRRFARHRHRRAPERIMRRIGPACVQPALRPGSSHRRAWLAAAAEDAMQPTVRLRSSAGQSTGFLNRSNWASRGETARRIRSNSGNAPTVRAPGPRPIPSQARTRHRRLREGVETRRAAPKGRRELRAHGEGIVQTTNACPLRAAAAEAEVG